LLHPASRRQTLLSGAVSVNFSFAFLISGDSGEFDIMSRCRLPTGYLINKKGIEAGAEAISQLPIHWLQIRARALFIPIALQSHPNQHCLTHQLLSTKINIPMRMWAQAKLKLALKLKTNPYAWRYIWVESVLQLQVPGVAKQVASDRFEIYKTIEMENI
jgi:hypothetical protein